MSDALQKIKHSQPDLYEHLKRIIIKLGKSNRSVSDFQEYSSNLKTSHKSELVFKVRQSFTHLKKYHEQAKMLLGKINVGTEEEPQEPTSLGYIPNFIEEARFYENFGIGFGEEESYLIFKSLSKFSLKKNAKQVKLWGKIMGTEKDYYIAEGVADGGEEGQLAPDTEPKGTGVNKISYWATNVLSGEWIELPIITPVQMKLSRRIKCILSGDLNRILLTNPYFPGKQSHLLKCLIVRISTTCTIVPKGLWAVNSEDPKQIQQPEEYTFPSVMELTKKQNWVYLCQSILKNGRTTLFKPQGLQPQEEQKWIKQMNEKDPSQPRLKSIAMDNKNWAIHSRGIQKVYWSLAKQPKTYSKGLVAVKNLIWSGWTTINYNGTYSSLYVGYGHKHGQTYAPVQPQTILNELKDSQEAQDQ